MTRSFQIFAGGLAILAAAVVSVEAETPHDVRIAVLQNVSSIPIAIQGSYEIIDPESGERLQTGRMFNRTLLKAGQKFLILGDAILETSHIRVIPRSLTTVWVGSNKKNYRGTLDIYLHDGRKLLVVNTLDVEQYIKGVLQHEISDKWPMEAIKAQAVAVRTYAYYQMQKNKNKLFDMTGDIYSQVYGGADAERRRTNFGTGQTAGLVLVFNSFIFPAYFHSTCGGRTEDARELWEGEDWPTLRGRECGFCKISPHYRWKKNYRSRDAQDALNGRGYNLGLIKEIRVAERDASGRIKTLQIETRDGRVVEITGKLFRDIVGPNLIKSNNYDIVMNGYYFDLIGRGWGHGVGLCQWGSLGMAREGLRYRDILKYYYPGVEIVPINQAQFNVPVKAHE